jgi:hypothetical protein
VRLRGHKYSDTWYIFSYSVSCCTLLIPVTGSIMNKGCWSQLWDSKYWTEVEYLLVKLLYVFVVCVNWNVK